MDFQTKKEIPEGYGELMDFDEHTDYYKKIDERLESLEVLLGKQSIWKKVFEVFTVSTATILAVIIFGSVIVMTQSNGTSQVITDRLYEMYNQ